jgi:hypothetical protein
MAGDGRLELPLFYSTIHVGHRAVVGVDCLGRDEVVGVDCWRGGSN